jgi:hypothetical protein
VVAAIPAARQKALSARISFMDVSPKPRPSERTFTAQPCDFNRIVGGQEKGTSGQMPLVPWVAASARKS